jgi:hypothetical protein
VVGAPEDQIQLSALPLIFGGRSICGSLTGTPFPDPDRELLARFIYT